MSKKTGYEAGAERIGSQYDSDEDLTPEERERIKDSRYPSSKREEIWKKKGSFDKLKKFLKAGYYGDKHDS